MPLTNEVIMKLNEITLLVEDKSKLTESETDEIKTIFRNLVKSNQRYDMDEIEYWFNNEGSWTVREPRIRIVNLANYVQDKYQQTAHLRILSDTSCNDDGCCNDGGNDSGSNDSSSDSNNDSHKC